MRVAIASIRFQYEGYPYVVTFLLPFSQYMRIEKDSIKTGKGGEFVTEKLTNILMYRWNLDPQRIKRGKVESVHFAVVAEEIEETSEDV